MMGAGSPPGPSCGLFGVAIRHPRAECGKQNACRTVSPCLRVGRDDRVGLCAGGARRPVPYIMPRWRVRRQGPPRVPMPTRAALSPSEVTRSVTHAGVESQTSPAKTPHAASVACCRSLLRHGPTLSEPPTCGAFVGGQSSATRAPSSSVTSTSTSRSARTTSPNFENVKPSSSVPSAPGRIPASSS